MKSDQKNFTIAHILLMKCGEQIWQARLIIKNKQGKVWGTGCRADQDLKDPGFQAVKEQIEQKTSFQLLIAQYMNEKKVSYYLRIQRRDSCVESQVSFYQAVVDELKSFFSFEIGVQEYLNVVQSTTVRKEETENWVGCPKLTIDPSGDLHMRFQDSRPENLPPWLQAMSSFLKKQYQVSTKQLQHPDSKEIQILSVSSRDVIKLTQETTKTTQPFLPLNQGICLYLKWLCENHDKLLSHSSNDQEIAAALLKDGRILFFTAADPSCHPHPPDLVVLSIEECSKKLNNTPHTTLHTMKEKFQKLPFVKPRPRIYPEQACEVLKQLILVRLPHPIVLKTFIFCCTKKNPLPWGSLGPYSLIALFFLDKCFLSSLPLAPQTDSRSTGLEGPHCSSIPATSRTVSQGGFWPTNNSRTEADSNQEVLLHHGRVLSD